MIKFFYGFDLSNLSNGSSDTPADLSGTGTITTIWNGLARPDSMYHNKGLGTLDKTISHPAAPSSSTRGGLASAGLNGRSGYIWGPSSSATLISGAYTGATTVTRATWATAQGHQLAFVRSLMNPVLSADEYWFSFDLYTPHVISANLDSSYEATTSWKQVFRWGDVSINCKSLTWDGSSRHTMLFSIRNAGTEVATLSVSGLDCDTNVSTDTPPALMYCRLRVKLHATQGAIEFYCNGNTQSVAYNNQNTVGTLSNAAATEFYFGPPVLDDGTSAYVGGIDNILIDDAEFPAGRPFIRFFTGLTNPSATDAAASSGAIHTAINSYTDGSQVRFLSTSGVFTIGKSALTTTNYHPTFLGFAGLLIRCANRYPQASRYIRFFAELSSVESAEGYAYNSTQLPFSSIITPPETNGVNQLFCIFTKTDNSKYLLSDYNNLLLKFKSGF